MNSVSEIQKTIKYGLKHFSILGISGFFLNKLTNDFLLIISFTMLYLMYIIWKNALPCMKQVLTKDKVNLMFIFAVLLVAMSFFFFILCLSRHITFLQIIIYLFLKGFYYIFG